MGEFDVLSPAMMGDDCDSILMRIHEHVRHYWQARDLQDSLYARGKVRDTLDELHQRCLGEWTQSNFDGLVEEVKKEYEMGSYLKRLGTGAREATLDFQELSKL